MEQLPRLRARIAALTGFHELIRALEALAATHYRAAQEALQVSARHLEIVGTACRALSAESGPPGGFGAVGDGYVPGVMIAICSEHGFVGAFNERILDRVQAELARGEELLVIGRRGAQIAGERSLKTVRGFPMAAHANSVPGLARQLSLAVSWAPRIRIVVSRHRPDGQDAIDCVTVAPDFAGPAPLADRLDRPLHQMPLEDLQAGFRHDLIFATIAHGLLESLASENATRLASMQSADRNVKDKLAQLSRRERSVRQEEITEELLDILVGAQSVTN